MKLYIEKIFQKLNIKYTTQNIVRIIILVPLCIYSLYSVGYFLTTELHPTYKDCGIVKSKSNDEVPIKHGSRTDLYLNIQFENSGFKSIQCDPTTYFSKSVGDYICFNLTKKENIWHYINSFIGVIVCFIAVALGLTLLVMYLIFDQDN